MTELRKVFVSREFNNRIEGIVSVYELIKIAQLVVTNLVVESEREHVRFETIVVDDKDRIYRVHFPVADTGESAAITTHLLEAANLFFAMTPQTGIRVQKNTNSMVDQVTPRVKKEVPNLDVCTLFRNRYGNEIIFVVGPEGRDTRTLGIPDLCDIVLGDDEHVHHWTRGYTRAYDEDEETINLSYVDSESAYTLRFSQTLWNLLRDMLRASQDEYYNE